jgi:hypothetical protein
MDMQERRSRRSNHTSDPGEDRRQLTRLLPGLVTVDEVDREDLRTGDHAVVRSLLPLPRGHYLGHDPVARMHGRHESLEQNLDTATRGGKCRHHMKSLHCRT